MNLLTVLGIILAVILIYRKLKFSHSRVVHNPPPKTLKLIDGNDQNYYHVGDYQFNQHLSFFQRIFRKKINNYLFMVDNTYKIQITLIDLGYIQILNANYFAEDHTFSFEQQIRFHLPQRFDQYITKINKSSKGFRLNVEQKKMQLDNKLAVQTTFDILITGKGGKFELKLTQIQPIISCITYFRGGVVSYKGYGGFGTGQIQISVDEKGKKLDKKLTLKKQNTITGFDGFRANGWQWKWVWGMGSGIDSLGRRFSINLGSIKQLGEDFIYVGDKTYKLMNFSYTLSEDTPIGQSIGFKSSFPVLDLKFKVTARQHKYQDMVLLKSDMVKFEGYWSGILIDPETQQNVTIDHFPGLVETADSIF